MRRLARGEPAVRGPRRQRGIGLVEMMVSIALSLLAVGTMLVLMSNTLGAGSTTIQMSRLSQELRSAMQLMTRDLRRANFHATFLQCFGNTNCRSDLGIASYVDRVRVSADGECIWFWLDRDADADLTDDAVGAFRLGAVDDVGVIEMRVAGNAAADCDAVTGWEPITDYRVVDITGFVVDDSASYTDTLTAGGDTQVVEKLRLTITGQMIRDNDVTRTIQDLVLVRNEVPVPGP